MIVVTGFPRGGTSLVTNCVVHILEQQFDGHNFQYKERFSEFEAVAPHETEAERDTRVAIAKILNPNLETELKEVLDMNPDGFYETSFSTSGLAYHPSRDAEYKHILRSNIDSLIESGTPTVTKIFLQGMPNTPPEYVDKVVLVVRNPIERMRSMKAFTTTLPVVDSELNRTNIFEKFEHSAESYYTMCKDAAEWLVANPSIPVHIVNFAKLQDDPDTVLKGLRSFLGQGVVPTGLVKTSLHRNKTPLPEEGTSLRKLHDLLLAGDFKALLEYVYSSECTEFIKARTWYCARTNTYTNDDVCIACKKDPSSLREYANKNKTPWLLRPCAYECGYDRSTTPKTITDSIFNNHWLDGSVCLP